MLTNNDIFLANLKPIEPPANLFEKIMVRIAQQKQLVVVKRRLYLFTFAILAVGVAFVPVFKILKTDVAQSGILYFVGLIFSDSSVIMTSWQNFLFSVLEILPITGLMAAAILIVAFLELTKFLVRDIYAILHGKQLYNN